MLPPVLRREWYSVRTDDLYWIVPLGDVHLGNAASDERLFRSVVNRIAEDERCYWIGLGDLCEFINRSDPRFDVDSLAPWIQVKHLGDLAGAQLDRLLGILEPIAPRCLALVEGNHERAIKKYYERDIYSDIVTGIKQKGGFEADHKLAIGYEGWLLLAFYWQEHRRGGSRVIKINLHHGFVGGKLAGAKALNMQRWLWNHDADIVIFGHSHNAGTQPEAVERVQNNRVTYDHRLGVYGGSFLAGAQYAKQKGYYPLAKTNVEIILQPMKRTKREQIRVISQL